jgi:hypothetical protein
MYTYIKEIHLNLYMYNMCMYTYVNMYTYSYIFIFMYMSQNEMFRRRVIIFHYNIHTFIKGMTGMTAAAFNDPNVIFYFKNAVVTSLSSISDIRYITVIVGTALDTSTNLRIRKYGASLHEKNEIHLSATSLSVSYTISIILESTVYSTPLLLRSALSTQLSLVFSNNEFVSTLQAQTASSWTSAGSASLTSLSDATVLILSTPVPTGLKYVLYT